MVDSIIEIEHVNAGCISAEELLKTQMAAKKIKYVVQAYNLINSTERGSDILYWRKPIRFSSCLFWCFGFTFRNPFLEKDIVEWSDLTYTDFNNESINSKNKS